MKFMEDYGENSTKQTLVTCIGFCIGLGIVGFSLVFIPILISKGIYWYVIIGMIIAIIVGLCIINNQKK